jgi:hypothetical protein
MERQFSGKWVPNMGRVAEYTKIPGVQLAALLYDFGVGSTVLKPEHQDWLDTNVPPFLVRTTSGKGEGLYRIFLIGLASPTGPDGLNRSLSKLRATNVEDRVKKIELLRTAGRGAARLLESSVKIAHGAEAARIAGLKSGVEDGKWRGVFLFITDQREMPPTPKPPRHTVPRRTSVEILVSDTMSRDLKMGLPMDASDRRAEILSQVARNISQDAFGVENVVHEQSKGIDEDWALAKVTFRTEIQSGLYIVKSLYVTYEWTAAQGRTVIVDTGKAKATVLTIDQATEWLYHPLKAYKAFSSKDH